MPLEQKIPESWNRVPPLVTPPPRTPYVGTGYQDHELSMKVLSFSTFAYSMTLGSSYVLSESWNCVAFLRKRIH